MVVDSLVLLVVSLGLGGLFLLSGAKKLADLAGFRATIDNYHLLPDALSPVAALLLPFAELGAGAVALAGLLRQDLPGLLPAALLLFLYAGAMGVNVARGRTHVDCGCLGFGASRSTIGWSLVLRNMFLGALALLLGILPVGGRALGMVDWISAAGALASGVIFYLAFDQIAALRAKREILR